MKKTVFCLMAILLVNIFCPGLYAQMGEKFIPGWIYILDENENVLSEYNLTEGADTDDRSLEFRFYKDEIVLVIKGEEIELPPEATYIYAAGPGGGYFPCPKPRKGSNSKNAP